jgi:mRNA interferase MazF
MRRGDIWTVAGGRDYAGKPRPAVIIQDNHFVAKDKPGSRIGRLDDEDLVRLNRGILVFLGLAGAPESGP